MEINEKVLEVFKEFNIRQSDGICYLISLYYGYSPTYIPDSLKMKVNATGIVEQSNTGIKWNVPLVAGQEVAFNWVKTEYVPLFKEANPGKGGKITDSIKRMKKFFSKNPEVRKDDVINATKIYLKNTDPKYIRMCHYFIYKGVGVKETSDLAEWVEKHNEMQSLGAGRNSKTNTMQ